MSMEIGRSMLSQTQRKEVERLEAKKGRTKQEEVMLNAYYKMIAYLGATHK